MKRIIRWLETKLSRQESPNPSDAPSDSEGAKPDEIDLGGDLPKELQDLVSDMPTPDFDLPKDLQEPEKSALMPDIYSDEQVDTVPNLKILDESPPDTDNSTGFNPYDTAKMHKKQQSRD